MHRALPLLCLLHTACGPNDDDIARDLFDEVAGWEDWAQVAPWTGIQPSSDGTHGSHVLITFNEVAAQAWGQDPLPYGSISVKRGFDGADDEVGRGFITVMKKIEGYDPEHGDWFWARISNSGEPGSEVGRSAFCSGCHTAGVDHLRTVTDTPGNES